MRAFARPALLPLVAVLIAFGLGVSGGFVYAHEPAAPEVRTSLSSTPSGPESTVRGTIAEIGPGYLEVTTAEGPRRLTFAPGVAVEELVALADAVPGDAAVNVGGNRTDSGFVITGVVVVSGTGR